MRVAPLAEHIIHRGRLVFGEAGVNPAPMFNVNRALTYTVEQKQKEDKQGLKRGRNIDGNKEGKTFQSSNVQTGRRRSRADMLCGG